ncbi:MAG: hypothetical protein KDC88_15755 [Ignavibacteriae bacterium]|nr:hypothetical protein [Ignavibacteriota bacterium]
MRFIIFLIILTNLKYSQIVYEIPFASKGNEIEIEVFNNSEYLLNDVAVTATEKPNWLEFDSEQEVISLMNGNENKSVIFRFNINENAKVLE